MSGFLSLLTRQNTALTRQNAKALLETNDVTRQFGLWLTSEEAVALLNTRDTALRETGRVEIGSGILDRLILAFCDSPYLNEENYADTICLLTELFYYMKNETLDQLTDDELLEKMKHYFDGSCNGSLELLSERELESMARNIRAYGTVEAPEEPTPVTVDESGEYPVEEDGKWRSIPL